MSIIDTLITDRTGGYYNAADLNRVENAVAYLTNRLHTAGYSVNATAKRDWTVNDIPTVTQMTAYLADITAIRNSLSVFSSTPATPSDMDGLTVQEANDIEKILLDVEDLITKMIAAYRHSGTFQAGEGGLRI